MVNGLCAVVIVSVLGCSSVANKDATVEKKKLEGNIINKERITNGGPADFNAIADALGCIFAPRLANQQVKKTLNKSLSTSLKFFVI